MIVFLNGKFVPEEQATVSIFDRGFLFGDGLFEALLVRRGKPFRWDEHFERLRRGAEFLKFNAPPSSGELLNATTELLQLNQMSECMMRLSLSRGVTERGYSPKHARNPALAITLHPAPRLDWTRLPRWPIIISSVRVPANDPLTSIKTANKLHHVLARAQADAAQAGEAILLNSDGNMAEGTSSNIFWIKDDALWTPSLSCGPLPGVTRGLVLDLCRQLNVTTHQIAATPNHLVQAQGVFLTMTSFGVVEATSLDGRPLSTAPLTGKIHAAFNEILNTD
jgi:branched-chain amino acid aminotransferase